MKPNTLSITMALCGTFSATAVFASDPTEEQLDALRSAIATAGCVINNEETATSVENATGFDEDLLLAAVEQLRASEEIVDVPGQGGIKLVSGQCEA